MRWRLRELVRVVLFLAVAAVATGASAETVRIRADEWCPYNCNPGTARPGYMIELVRAILEPAGYTVDYETLNWVRAVEETRRGAFEAIVGATRLEADGFVVPRSALGGTISGVAMRKGTRLDLNAPDPFAPFVMASVRGYDYGKPLTGYIARFANDPKRVQLVAGDSALDQNLRKLLSRRVDLVVDDVNRLLLTLSDRGLAGKLDVVPVTESEPLFIAFSPEAPKAALYADLIDQGMTRLRGSGQLAVILARYGLKDWENP